MMPKCYFLRIRVIILLEEMTEMSLTERPEERTILRPKYEYGKTRM
jgi:hypothetical protein